MSRFPMAGRWWPAHIYLLGNNLINYTLMVYIYNNLKKKIKLACKMKAKNAVSLSIYIRDLSHVMIETCFLHETSLSPLQKQYLPFQSGYSFEGSLSES